MRHSKTICGISVFALNVSAFTGFAQAKNFNMDIKTRVSPALKLHKIDDLHFGSIAANAVTASTVVVDPAADNVSTCGTMLTCVENGDRALFKITGRKNTAINVSISNSIVMTDGGANSMTADNFTMHAAGLGNGNGYTQGNGALQMGVGATLHIGAGQEPGLYTGSFIVTADYQ